MEEGTGALASTAGPPATAAAGPPAAAAGEVAREGVDGLVPLLTGVSDQKLHQALTAATILLPDLSRSPGVTQAGSTRPSSDATAASAAAVVCNAGQAPNFPKDWNSPSLIKHGLGWPALACGCMGEPTTGVNNNLCSYLHH